MICKHCGIALEYYSSTQHADRPSCHVSPTKYHYFVTYPYYICYTVYRSCRKNSKDAGYPMQTPLRVHGSGNEG